MWLPSPRSSDRPAPGSTTSCSACSGCGRRRRRACPHRSSGRPRCRCRRRTGSGPGRSRRRSRTAPARSGACLRRRSPGCAVRAVTVRRAPKGSRTRHSPKVAVTTRRTETLMTLKSRQDPSRHWLVGEPVDRLLRGRHLPCLDASCCPPDRLDGAQASRDRRSLEYRRRHQPAHQGAHREPKVDTGGQGAVSEVSSPRDSTLTNAPAGIEVERAPGTVRGRTRSCEDGTAGFYLRSTIGVIARIEVTVGYVAEALRAFGTPTTSTPEG